VKYAVIKEREGVGVQNEEKVIRDITVNNVVSGLTVKEEVKDQLRRL
jgi:hypothetical protein